MDELRLISIDKDKAIAEGKPVFDLDIDILDGAAEQIAGDTAELMRAYIACYTKSGAIPLQEDKGIDWTAFLRGEKPYNEIASETTARIADFVGAGKYVPSFRQEGRQMKFYLLTIA